MKNSPLDRLLSDASRAPGRPDPELDLGLENRVLAAVRAARRATDPLPLLRVLRIGLGLAGATAAFSVYLTVNDGMAPQNRLVTVEEAFTVPEPETYLALQ